MEGSVKVPGYPKSNKTPRMDNGQWTKDKTHRPGLELKIKN